MTINEALTLHKGSRVWSTVTTNPEKGYCVTDIWVNEARTIGRVRIHKLAGNDWLPTEGFEKQPPAKRGTP